MKKLSLLLFSFGALFWGVDLPKVSAQPPRTPHLELVLAKDHLEGSFTTPQSVYADNRYIYLASQQGILYILEKTRSFPVAAALRISASPLMAVRGDSKSIYVAAADGKTYVYSKKKPFPFVAAILPGTALSLNSIGVDPALDGSYFVSSGETSMAIDNRYVYLSAVHYGDVAYKENKITFAVEQTFGLLFEPFVTVVYDRNTGARVRAVPDPLDIYSNGGQQAALYAGDGLLIQTTPGCCGAGMFLYGAEYTQFLGLIPLPSANTAATSGKGKLLVAGTEAGTVDLFDVTSPNVPVSLGSVNLRTATGHTGIEDIEIRSLWVDKNMIYAGSSWGNDQSRGPTLPSFFVLRIR